MRFARGQRFHPPGLLGLAGSSIRAQLLDTTAGYLQKEAASAASLYDAQNFVAALPLYEDLQRRAPENLVDDEHLAMSLVGAAGTRPAIEQLAFVARSRQCRRAFLQRCLIYFGHQDWGRPQTRAAIRSTWIRVSFGGICGRRVLGLEGAAQKALPTPHAWTVE